MSDTPADPRVPLSKVERIVREEIAKLEDAHAYGFPEVIDGSGDMGPEGIIPRLRALAAADAAVSPEPAGPSGAAGSAIASENWNDTSRGSAEAELAEALRELLGMPVRAVALNAVQAGIVNRSQRVLDAYDARAATTEPEAE
jgi:hypothetical protein